jgi:hypothetical protein
LSNEPFAKQNVRAAATPASATSPTGAGASGLSDEALRVLVDSAAVFNAYVAPDPARAVQTEMKNGAVTGFRCGGLLHRFDLELQPPSHSCVKAVNLLGEAVGRVEMRWIIIPNSYTARPDAEPPPTPFDRSCSQRFSMQEMTFTFGDGREGFRSFGTGRTFPVVCNGRQRTVVSAIGNITEGSGKFQGHNGNFTLCGELLPDGGFAGHIITRVVDEQGNLHTSELLPPPTDLVQRADADSTYVAWLAQKGKGPIMENRPSFTPDGEVRGLNIAMELKLGKSNFTVDQAQGFRSSTLQVGEAIGLEEGYGRQSNPNAGPEGTALNPFQFEGVARYSFYDREGKTAGAIVTNVLEGRRFDFWFAAAPNKISWRFGFFGPIIYGTGCFRGAEGMFYGASHSFFDPPPGAHIITHCYFARLYDPTGEYRAASISGVQ